jgi:transposase
MAKKRVGSETTEEAKFGRPTKLTQDLQDRIVNAIRAGNYMETAALANGVSKVIIYNWLKRGSRAERGEPENEYDKDYIDFFNAVQKALGESEQIALAQIVRAANEGQWQAAAWRLERRFPDKWGRHSNVNLNVAGSLANVKLTDEDEQAYREAVAKFFRSDDTDI